MKWVSVTNKLTGRHGFFYIWRQRWIGSQGFPITLSDQVTSNGQQHIAALQVSTHRGEVTYMIDHKNISRHTGHTIVSWPNPKQWMILHTSDLTMIRQSIYILSIITREMGKLKTHSPTICKPKCVRLFALIIKCAMIMKTNSRFFPECICNKWQNIMKQTSQAHNHRKTW